MNTTGKKLKIGVFGGNRGMVMIDVLLKHPDATLVAVCDFYQPVLDQVKKKAEERGIDVACYSSFDDFILCDMDAVVLANYATEHTPFAIRCLRAGKHVMSEVLPSQTLAEAVQLIETVEETGLVYTYAENYCYMDTTFEMWRRYKTGGIGEVRYAEADYLHDCASCWLDITYGEADHWRNHIYPTFYCTHSLGPVLMATGRRPVKVIGFENPPVDEWYDLGHVGGHGSGGEMVFLDNGAVIKSIHGPYKHPSCTGYRIFGDRGCITTRDDGKNVLAYEEEAGKPCEGKKEIYEPQSFVSTELKKNIGAMTHGGSDFYATHFFIEKILGREDGQWAIDVYQAVDMGICGILAFRSILNGNAPVEVPNFRNKEERDKYRNDTACTDPDVAGDQLIPCSVYPERVMNEEEKKDLKARWLKRVAEKKE